MDKVFNLLERDARRLRRDNMLLFLIAYPFLAALAIRLAAPLIPVENLALYLAPALIMFAPLAFGMVFGFNLIEEKEEQTWLLIRVVPLPRTIYISYLIAASVLPSFALALATALLFGQPVAHVGLFLLMALAASLTAPLWTLLLGVLASNKVEGFALAKVVSFVMVLPGLAFVLTPAMQLSIAWNPWYWIYIGLLKAYAGTALLDTLAINMPEYPTPVFWLAPLLLSTVLIAYLARVWRKKAE